MWRQMKFLVPVTRKRIQRVEHRRFEVHGSPEKAVSRGPHKTLHRVQYGERKRCGPNEKTRDAERNREPFPSTQLSGDLCVKEAKAVGMKNDSAYDKRQTPRPSRAPIKHISRIHVQPLIRIPSNRYAQSVYHDGPERWHAKDIYHKGSPAERSLKSAILHSELVWARFAVESGINSRRS